jgi:type VI secretion system protein ImpC
MDLEVRLGRRGEAGRGGPAGGARRILVLGDFAGRGSRDNAAAREPLATRTIVLVPREGDGVDAVIKALAPVVSLPSSIAGAAEALEISSLDDFHPDTLFRRLAVFRDPPRAAAPAGAGAPRGEATDDMARLLGKRATKPASSADDLIRSIVAAHVVSAPAHAPLDAAALGRIMRVVLHEPAFQALEARWRALELLASRAEEAVEIAVLDVTREELLADLGPAGAEATLDGSALAKRVLSPPGGRTFAALIADFAFGPGAEDAALLGRLSAVAAAGQAPLITGAAPAMLGCGSLAGADDPARWEAPAPEDARRWQGLRRTPAAAWMGLTLPRFLARAPYGAKTIAIDAFGFEEIEDRPAAEMLCWANGAFLAALALVRGEEADDSGEIDDLPFFTFRSEGDVEMYPSAEVFWGQRAADAALARGLMPLLCSRNRNGVRLVRLQSIADPPRALGADA